MSWYLKALSLFMRWYGERSPQDARPEGWTTILFPVLHYLNVLAVWIAYARATGKSDVWVVSTGAKVIGTAVPVFAFYVFYFGAKLRQIRESPKYNEEYSLVRTPAEIGVICYVVGSVVLAVGAVCYAAK